jgi:hypothetical protein
MERDTDYNGWANKATWLVKLWIDNNQYGQEYWLERAGAYGDNAYEFGQELQDSFEETAPTEPNGFYTDLMNWALASVDWAAIARAFIEDAAEIGN